MRNEGLSDAAIQAFSYAYRELVSGQSGMILESSISPVDHLPDLDSEIKGTITRDPNLLQVSQPSPPFYLSSLISSLSSGFSSVHSFPRILWF